MKAVTSVTLWNDAVGKRMSVTYSEVDEETGRVTKDNLRIDRVITDKSAQKSMQAILAYSQDFVDAE